MLDLTRILAALLIVLGLGTGSAFAAGGGGDGDKESKDPKYLEAKGLVEDGQYAQAIPLLEQIVASDPKNADAFNYLGYSQRKSGDKDAAMANYQKALALQPEHLGANEYLGELYLELGKLAEAEQRLEVLDSACFFGCDEYYELKDKIEKFRTNQSS